MPTYSYACTECNHRFDAVQSFTDATLTECPTCSGRLRKLFNTVGIVFKGSGFYRNDSRADNRQGAKSGAKESGGKESGAKESGGEASAKKDTSTKDGAKAEKAPSAAKSDSGGSKSKASAGASSTAG